MDSSRHQPLLAFTPNGKLLVTGNKDAQIKLWILSKSQQDNNFNCKSEYSMSLIPY